MKKIDSGLHYPLDMNTLSKTWSVSYIGDVAIEIQPGFASGEHNQEGTGIPHVRPMNINRQGNLDLSVVKYVSPDKDKKRLRAGDVLFNNTNSPELIGKTTVINKDIDWAFSNHMTRIVFPQEVSPKFVAYQLHFLWSMGYFLHKCVKHVNQASISSKTLGDSVPLILAPFNDQKLIVSEIEKQFSRLDEAVAALKRVRASLKRYKASVLKAAVEGKLTEEWRKENPNVEPADKLLKRILAERKKKWEEANPKKKYKEPVAPDTSNRPELPKGWVWATLESVSDALGGYAFESKKFSISGYQIVKMANVKMSKIDLSQQPSFISEVRPDIVAKYSLNTGDVIVTLTGTRKKRDYGYVAVVNSNLKALLNQRLARLRPYKGLIPKYLEIAMQSEVYRNRFFSYETGNVGQGNVGMGVVTKEPIAFPPYQEQLQIIEEIESRLSITEEIEETIDINLKRAERLRQAILKKAFSGKLISQEKIHG